MNGFEMVGIMTGRRRTLPCGVRLVHFDRIGEESAFVL